MAANKNKGLGMGLSALIGINELDQEFTSEAEGVADAPITELDISLIDPNVEQPRKNFDADALAELAESIKSVGIIQPIVVNGMGARYMIIAGERRFRAAKIAGLTSVPVIIRHYTDREIREISLIENLQREDLNPIEAARAIKALMEECGLTQEETATRIGKNRSTVANTLRLLTLSQGVMAMVEKGTLSSGHARTLVVVENPADQLKLAEKAVAEGLSVRGIEQLVKEYLNPPLKKEKKDNKSLELKSLVYDMQRVFATKVSAVTNGKKGRIYIDFYNDDDLDRIADLVGKWMDNKPR